MFGFSENSNEALGIRSGFPNRPTRPRASVRDFRIVHLAPGHSFGISENNNEASGIYSGTEEDATEAWKSKSELKFDHYIFFNLKFIL